MVFCNEFLDGWWSLEPLCRSCVRCGWWRAPSAPYTLSAREVRMALSAREVRMAMSAREVRMALSAREVRMFCTVC